MFIRQIQKLFHKSCVPINQIDDGRRTAEMQKMAKRSMALETKSWYHGTIGREESELRTVSAGLINGTFLVRCRESHYVITLCFENSINHYLVNVVGSSYHIPGGKKFSNLIQLIHHHHRHKDGLPCTLTRPVQKQFANSSVSRRLVFSSPSTSESFPPGVVTARSHSQCFRSPANSPIMCSSSVPDCLSSQTPQSLVTRTPPGCVNSLPLNKSADKFRNGRVSFKDVDQSRSTPALASKSPTYNVNINSSYSFSSPKKSANEQSSCKADPLFSNPIGTNDMKISENHVLKDCDLFVYYQIGKGNFGVVMYGVLKDADQEQAVAVKVLKSVCSKQKADPSHLLWEAKVMSELHHPHIISFIGIISGPPLMIVSELAAMGQLNKFLRQKKDLTLELLMSYIYQVAQGMEYLELKSFVHRDLAARNVLMATERHVKISDFGMSRILPDDKDFYTSSSGGHWPVRWYAPQCIYFFRFNHKTDVWSFAVTAWEIFSMGARPYGTLSTPEILAFLERGERLQRPLACPIEMYALLLRCWENSEEYRPNFNEIRQVIEIFYHAMTSSSTNPSSKNEKY